MQLSPHFTLDEFTDSATAFRMEIDNDLPIGLHESARATAALMEAVRGHLSSIAGRPVPIVLTSGYRCLKLNRAIGSSDSSDHIKASAVDFKAPSFGNARAVCMALVPVFDALRIGQLILEHESWTHISTRTPDKIINRILTIDKTGAFAGIRGQ